MAATTSKDIFNSLQLLSIVARNSFFWLNAGAEDWSELFIGDWQGRKLDWFQTKDSVKQQLDRPCLNYWQLHVDLVRLTLESTEDNFVILGALLECLSLPNTRSYGKIYLSPTFLVSLQCCSDIIRVFFDNYLPLLLNYQFSFLITQSEWWSTEFKKLLKNSFVHR